VLRVRLDRALLPPVPNVLRAGDIVAGAIGGCAMRCPVPRCKSFVKYSAAKGLWDLTKHLRMAHGSWAVDEYAIRPLRKRHP